MKRFLLTGLFLIGLGQMVSFAQNDTYKDDIYYKSSDIANDNQNEEEEQARRKNNDDSSYYYSSDESSDDRGGYSTYQKSYNTDEYVDYDDDGYYATRISRFNYPFYNMGYYSMFYNPFWYDPFYSDYYGGWSYWNRPGVSFSFGYGPYWNSYWGYYSWYGYPGFYSYYNYPCYTGWYDGGYYSGYWNGYYAGVYGSSVHHNSISYGPRSSMNTAYNTGIRSNRLRQSLGAGNQVASPRSPLRSIELNNQRPVRNASVRQPERNVSASSSGRDREIRFNNNQPGRTDASGNANERPVRRQFSDRADGFDEPRNANVRDDRQQDDRQQMDVRQDRPRQMQQDRPRQMEQRQPERQVQREEPRYERQRSEPRYEQPRSEPRYQPAQRMESPRMSPSPSSAPRGRR